jgi:hypothetical protein
VIRIAVSSLSTATITERAAAIPASPSTSCELALPATAAIPSAVARARAPALSSMTTISSGSVPLPSRM